MNTASSTLEGFSIYPIGYIKTQFEDVKFEEVANEDPEQRKLRFKAHQEKLRENTSVVEVMPEYSKLLDGIDAFSHIVILFWPHRLPEEKRHIEEVHPRGWKDIPMQGIFATRSPARPNPILSSTVSLIKREGRLLHVKGLDAMDESPVIDIKPVVAPSDVKGTFRVPDWIEHLLGKQKS